MKGDNLEYLMSSLPYLPFQGTEEDQQNISLLLKKYQGSADEQIDMIEILDQEAEKFLSEEESKVFKRIALTTIQESFFQDHSNFALSNYSSFTYQLKNNLAKLRTERKNGTNRDSIKITNLPLVPGNPLEEELQLLKFQWDKLDELAVGHHADFDAIIIYKIKLLLLLKQWSFNQDKGFELFIQLIEKDRK